MKANFEKGTKICSRCKKELPLSMFTKHKSKSDGLNVYCKECSNIRQKKEKDVLGNLMGKDLSLYVELVNMQNGVRY